MNALLRLDLLQITCNLYYVADTSTGMDPTLNGLMKIRRAGYHHRLISVMNTRCYAWTIIDRTLIEMATTRFGSFLFYPLLQTNHIVTRD